MTNDYDVICYDNKDKIVYKIFYRGCLADLLQMMRNGYVKFSEYTKHNYKSEIICYLTQYAKVEVIKHV